MSENQRRLHAALDPGCHPKAQRSQHILLRHAESPERPLRPVEIGIGLRMPDIQELFADSGLRFSCESLAALDGLRRQQAARCLPLAAVVRMPIARVAMTCDRHASPDPRISKLRSQSSGCRMISATAMQAIANADAFVGVNHSRHSATCMRSIGSLRCAGASITTIPVTRSTTSRLR